MWVFLHEEEQRWVNEWDSKRGQQSQSKCCSWWQPARQTGHEAAGRNTTSRGAAFGNTTYLCWLTKGSLRSQRYNPPTNQRAQRSRRYRTTAPRGSVLCKEWPTSGAPSPPRFAVFYVKEASILCKRELLLSAELYQSPPTVRREAVLSAVFWYKHWCYTSIINLYHLFS